MLDFYEKRKLKSIVFSIPVILLLLAASCLLGLSVFARYEKERETAARTAERAAILEELEQRAEILEARVRYTQSTRGVEEEIRNRYDVVKDGEQAVIIMGGKGQSARPELLPLPSRTEDRSFFSRLLFWR